MNELLNKLFGLGSEQSLGFGSPDAQLTFVHPLQSWLVTMLIGAIVLAVWWSYRSLPGAKSTRIILGAVRTAVLIALFALALGPMIEQRLIHTEQDWVLVLLDRSGSMDTRDALVDIDNAQQLTTREGQLLAMLEADTHTQAWAELADRKRVVWMGFGDSANTLSIGAPPTIDSLGPIGGQSTNLGAAIAHALELSAARPISAIVIASDGRSFDPINPELINTIKGAQIPIFTIPLGSAEPVRDLGITRIEHPSAVFGDDLVPIRVLLAGSGIDAAMLRDGRVRVELIDHATGRVLGSTPVEPAHLGLDPDTDQPWLIVNHTPEGVGERAFDLIIRTDQSSAGWDLNPTNDQSSIRLSVVERPMRVLYIDGYPRWEHRYLKNLLLRERSIVSSSMLLAASRRYIQEGDEPIVAVPATIDQWEPFDVIILGDVRPELFSDQQLESLKEHITKHGAGLLWIAGPSANPVSWLDSELSALLPMRRDAGGSQRTIRPWDSPVTMRSTDEADRLGLLGLNDDRTGWADRLSDPRTGWSKLRWALNLDETSFKPGVSVLASAQPVNGSTNDSNSSPIITMMRFGSGRTIFVGTDEIWRWRYGRGEDLPERFWLPMIRSLGRGTVDRRSAPASLTISPASPSPGNPTTITLRLFDQARIDSMPKEIRVELRSSSALDEPEIISLRGAGDTRIGTWIPQTPGSYKATLEGLDLALSEINARARVLDVSSEQRELDADHELLISLAEQSNGQTVIPDAFDTIPSLLPNRMRTIVSPPNQSPLWDRPIVLIVLVLMLSVEWIGRRVLRLA